MARVKRSIMETNAFRLLAYLDSGAKGRRQTAVVSLRSMATDLQLSQARARRLVRILVDQGYIEVHRRYAEDGGDRPNAHSITRAGKAALKEHRIVLQSAERSKDRGDAAGVLVGVTNGQQETD